MLSRPGGGSSIGGWVLLSAELPAEELATAAVLLLLPEIPMPEVSSSSPHEMFSSGSLP